ncbi:MAG: ribonuclease P protein component [Anaerolineaceae bacterium]|nr:ribonuclease P protein component [Anaerolineaceae bacterium]
MKKEISWLKNSIAIREARKCGQAHADRLMIIISKPNQLGHSRFAVIASRSVGSAVERNRCKRILRACVHQNLADYKPGFDILYIARKPLLQAAHTQVLSSFGQLNRDAEVVIYV